jgi:phage tail-like protein
MPTINNNRSSLATDPLRNFRYLVTFTPLTNVNGTANTNTAMTNLATPPVSFGFTSISGMSITTDSIPYREGGYNTTVHQIPGQTTFAPITFQRGVILGTSTNWDWMKNLFATVQGGGSSRAAGDNFRCDIEIKVLAHPVPTGAVVDATGGTPATQSATDVVAMRFMVYNAWPTSVSYSDLNAGDNALLVEQMSVVHEGFDISWGDKDKIAESALPFTVAGGSSTASKAPGAAVPQP